MKADIHIYDIHIYDIHIYDIQNLQSSFTVYTKINTTWILQFIMYNTQIYDLHIRYTPN